MLCMNFVLDFRRNFFLPKPESNPGDAPDDNEIRYNFFHFFRTNLLKPIQNVVNSP